MECCTEDGIGIPNFLFSTLPTCVQFFGEKSTALSTFLSISFFSESKHSLIYIFYAYSNYM
jgi:hypothetical protein